MNHPEQQKNSSKKYRDNKRQDIKLEIHRLLGSRCANSECPIPFDKLDFRRLHIDHVNNDGYEERKIYHNTDKYYEHILSQIKNGSKAYQLLCPYCNWLKRYEKT